MRCNRLVWAGVTAALMGTLGACGGDDDDAPAAEGEGLRIAGTEMAFSPAAPTTIVGRHEIVFVNEGKIYHELAVLAPDGTVLGARSIPAGQSVTFEVDLEGPGEFEMVCREPGHTEAGMVGTLTVTG
jgi:plastocyanin